MKNSILSKAAFAALISSLMLAAPIQLCANEKYVNSTSLNDALKKIEEAKGNSPTDLQEDIKLLQQQFSLDNEKAKSGGFEERSINSRIDNLLSHYTSLHNQTPEVNIHYPSYSYSKQCNGGNCIFTATVSKELLDSAIFQLQNRDGETKNKITYIRSLKNVMPLSKRVNMLEQEEASLRNQTQAHNNSIMSTTLTTDVIIANGDTYKSRKIFADENKITIK